VRGECFVGGAALEAPLVRHELGQSAPGRIGGQSIQPEQLRLKKTPAGVRRHVGQSVGRHEPVQAAAADPVIDVPVLGLEIDVLDPGPRGDEVLFRRPAAVAAVVEPVDLDVGQELLLDLARSQITPGEHAGVAAVGNGPAPDQPADDEHVVGRHVPAAVMGGGPQCVPVVGREGRHRAVFHREQNHVLANNQRRAVARGEGRFVGNRLGMPQRLAAGTVHGGDLLAVVEVNSLTVHAERQRGNPGLPFPRGPAGRRVDGHQPAVLSIPGPLAVGPAGIGPNVRALGAVLLPLVGRPGHQDEQGAVADQHLVGVLGAGVSANGLASGRVESFQRGVDPQRDVDPAAHGHQPPRKLVRPALQRPEVRVPLVDRPLPKQRAAVGVPSDERPLGGQQDRLAGAFVHDVEHPAAGRDHGA